MSQLITYDTWSDISKDTYSALSVILSESNIDNVDDFQQSTADKNRFAMQYSSLKRNFYLKRDLDWKFAVYTGKIITEENSQGTKLYKMPSNFIRFTKDNYYFSNAQITYVRNFPEVMLGKTFDYIGYVKDSNNDDGRIVPYEFHEIVAYEYLLRNAKTPESKFKYIQYRFEAEQRAIKNN